MPVLELPPAPPTREISENDARLLVRLLGEKQAAALVGELGDLVTKRAYGEVKLVVHAGTIHTIVTQQQVKF